MWRLTRRPPCLIFMACWTPWSASGRACWPAWMLQRYTAFSRLCQTAHTLLHWHLWDMRCTHTAQHEHIVCRLMSSHKTADGRLCMSLLCTLLIAIEMKSSLARITTWRCVWSLQDEVLRNGNILETAMCTSAQCCTLLTAGGEQETCEHKQGPLRALGVCTAAAGAGHFQVAACLCATSSSNSNSNSSTCISTGESANRYSVPQSAPQRLSGRMKHSSSRYIRPRLSLSWRSDR